MSKRDPKAKRRTWFDLGADAVDRVWPGGPRSYLCPTCPTDVAWLPAAVDSGDLTAEHVPPRALGGKELILTCRDCNNKAGALVDTQMRNREDVIDLVRGTMKRPVRARLKTGSGQVNVEVQAVGKEFKVDVPDQINDPIAIAQFKSSLGQPVKGQQTEGVEITLSGKKGFQNRESLVGWLRSAYLVAFAVLGYKYAFHPALEAVRKQIAAPGDPVLRIFSVTVSDSTLEHRRTFFVEAPSDLRALAVLMDRHLVFLPWPQYGNDIYGNLEVRAESDMLFNTPMSGSSFPWPTGPQHTLDFWEP